MGLVRGSQPALVLLVCVAVLTTYAQPDRCPDSSDLDYIGSGLSGSGSGLPASGGGLSGSGDSGISCEELCQEENPLQGLNYFCRHVDPPSVNCTTPLCLTCQGLLACDIPVTLYGACSSGIVLTCSVLADIQDEVEMLFRDACDFFETTCLNNSNTGVCEAGRMHQSCHTLTSLPFPCDCFASNTTCDVCERLVILCPDLPDTSGGGIVSGSGGDIDICSYLESEEGIGYVFLCQSIPAGEDCHYSSETCDICNFINFGGCHDLPPVTIADICAVSRLVTACNFPTVVSQHQFFEEICSFITAGACGRNTSTCVGDHCQVCNYLTSGEGLGYIFLCHSLEAGSHCHYSNETCTLCPFINSGVCPNFPNVTQSDLCQISKLVSVCDYYLSGLYPSDSDFFSDICPFTANCSDSGGSISGSGGSSITSGFYISGFGSASGIGSGDNFCYEVEFESPGFVYYCLTNFSSFQCSYSQTLCAFCGLLFGCPDLVPPPTNAVCSNIDSISPCIVGVQGLGCYCADIMALCTAGEGSSLCEVKGLIENCTETLISSSEGACEEDPEICSNCVSVLEYCLPTLSVMPSLSKSVGFLPSPYVAPMLTTTLSSAFVKTSFVVKPPTHTTEESPKPTSQEPTQVYSTTQLLVPGVPSQILSSVLPRVTVTSTSEPISYTSAHPPTASTPTSEPSIPLSPTSSTSTSEPSIPPSPTTSTPTFPEGSSIDVDKLNEEQEENTISIEIEGIMIVAFLENELRFRTSVAEALNKAGDRLLKRRNSDDEFTADDIIYVGQPLMTDSGAVLVAFFAQFPDGKVVDGRLLVKAVDDNSDDISDAAGGKVQEIKKGVPEALRQETSESESDDDGDGLSAGAVAAIVIIVILVVAVLVFVAVAMVLVFFRRQRKSFAVAASSSSYTTVENEAVEEERGGGAGGDRSFPLRTGYEAAPTQSVTAAEQPTEAAEEDTLDEPKVTHL